MTALRIGFVTVGQGPRPELDDVHARLFDRMGMAVRLLNRHALDGMDLAAIEPMVAAAGDPAVHCFVRDGIGQGSALGPGWGSRWARRDALIGPIQACIDALETQDEVDATVLCVSEDFPAPFASRRLLVIPYRTMLGYAQALAATKPGARIAMLTNGARQLAQQQAAWAARDWTRTLAVDFIEIAGDPLGAAGRAAGTRPDLVMVCAYAVGMAPGDAPDLLPRMAAAAGARVLIPAVTACAFLRPLASEGLRDGAVP